MAASVTSPLCSDIKGFLLSVFLRTGCVCVWGEASGMGSDVMGEWDYRNLLRHISHRQLVHWATWDWQRHPSHKRTSTAAGTHKRILMNGREKHTHTYKSEKITNNLHRLQTIPLRGNIKGTCWYANIAVLCTATVPACRDNSFSHAYLWINSNI